MAVPPPPLHNLNLPGNQYILQSLHTTPPVTQSQCPHCMQMMDTDMLASITHHSIGTAWYGCYGCLASAHRRMQQHYAAASSDVLALLLRAKRAITEPTDASEIDALCQAIDLAYLAART
jgi:hypothetical protein